MRNRKLICLLSVVCVSIFFLYGVAGTEINPVYKPEKFPSLTFENILSKKEQMYLGTPKKKFFSFNEIKGSLIVVELTSIYCVSCKKNIPLLNEIYEKIQKDSALKGKVKLIGIAIGNNRNEVESLKNEYEVLYPLLTDPDFSAYEALGEPQVPYTMCVRRDAKGKYFILNIHKGAIESADSFMNNIKIICSEHFQKYAF